MYQAKVISKNYPSLFAKAINHPLPVQHMLSMRDRQSLGLHYNNVVPYKDVTRGGIKISFQRLNGWKIQLINYH